jgi:hypothetical protein
MTDLTDDEREMLLRLIDMMIAATQIDRLGNAEFMRLVSIRRKLEGVDKRVSVDEA